MIHSNDVGNIFCQQFLFFFADFARKSNKDTFDWRRRMQMFALYSGYIKVLQNSFDPIEIMMSICIQVALLLGIFLSSSLAQTTKFCANSVAQCQSQCTSSGGNILSFAGYCDLANPVCISLAKWLKIWNNWKIRILRDLLSELSIQYNIPLLRAI